MDADRCRRCWPATLRSRRPPGYLGTFADTAHALGCRAARWSPRQPDGTLRSGLRLVAVHAGTSTSPCMSEQRARPCRPGRDQLPAGRAYADRHLRTFGRQRNSASGPGRLRPLPEARAMGAVRRHPADRQRRSRVPRRIISTLHEEGAWRCGAAHRRLGGDWPRPGAGARQRRGGGVIRRSDADLAAAAYLGCRGAGSHALPPQISSGSSA